MPRCTERGPPRRGRACAGFACVERDRARCEARRSAGDRRHRHEREDDDDRASRRDVPGRSPVRCGRRQRRPSPVLARRRGRCRRCGRLRAFELPARGHRDPAAPGGRSAQPDAGPPRPPRQPRRLPRRQAPDLREPDAGRRGRRAAQGSPRSQAARAASNSAQTTLCRPSRASPASTTGERRRDRRRCARRRDPGRRDRRGAADAFRASPSAGADPRARRVSASSTTRRPRTPSRPSARLRAYHRASG